MSFVRCRACAISEESMPITDILTRLFTVNSIYNLDRKNNCITTNFINYAVFFLFLLYYIASSTLLIITDSSYILLVKIYLEI